VFSVIGRQHTNAIRALGLAARRMWAKAATGSPKNITPKFDASKSNPSSVAVAASACSQSMLAMPAASARACPSASIGAEMSSDCGN
jgi:hypothetical protein